MTLDLYFKTLGQEHAQLILEFFIYFTRIEYALKEASFVRRGARNVAEPDWTSFSQNIDKSFSAVKDTQVLTAKEYFINNPTQVQILSNGNLVWREQERDGGTSETEWLTVLVRTVRNNLFHGSKTIYKPERDTQLLTHSLILIRCWAELSSKVKQALNNIDQ